MKIIVTGGAGFIGSALVRRLVKDGHSVLNLDNLTYAGNLKSVASVCSEENYRYVRADICSGRAISTVIKEFQPDAIMHLAAESHVDRSITGPAEFIQTNIFGTFTLLETARAYWLTDGADADSCRFLHVSTDEVFGSLGTTGFFTEHTCYDPRSPYSASKASSDHLVRAYFHTYGLPILITNCSNNYGPYQFPEKLIPLVLNNALQGKDLPVYGDGGNIRDWLYVRDHCEAIARVVEKGTIGESYNIGGHNEKKNLQVVELLCDMLDKKVGKLDSGKPRRSLITFVKDRLGHDRRYAIDAGKIDEKLGWTPKFTFEQGIDTTVDWYLQNRAWMDSVMDGSYQKYYEKMYG